MKKKTIMACNNFTEQVYKILYLQTDRFGDFNTTIKNLFENFIWRGFNNVFQFLCKGTSIHVHVRCMFMQKLIWACFYTYFLVLFLLCVYWDTQEEQCQDSLLNEKKNHIKLLNSTSMCFDNIRIHFMKMIIVS